MQLEQQVCALDLAKKLKELGVKQRGVLFAYFFNAGQPTGAIVDATMYDGMDEDYWKAKLVAAFTVAELGEMLPDEVNIEDKPAFLCGRVYDTHGKRYYEVSYRSEWDTWMDRECEVSEADARAKMLIYLIETQLISLP